MSITALEKCRKFSNRCSPEEPRLGAGFIRPAPWPNEFDLRKLLRAVARDLDPAHRQKRRHLGPAALDGVGATRVKSAARGRIERRRQFAAKRDALAPRPGIECWCARQECARVGMRGPREDRGLG